jgi:hypothetical protein
LLVAGLLWAGIETGESSRPSNVPMFVAFLVLAPIAIAYSFCSKRAAPDRVAAKAAFIGSFLVGLCLLLMVAGILYSLVFVH